MLKNVLWNLSGQVLPLLAALVCIPVLIHGLGVERFGILSLVWIVIGYFSLFDFGIGRAVTKLVAEKRHSVKAHEIPRIIATSLVLLTGIGFIIMTLGLVLADNIAARIISASSSNQLETIRVLTLLSLATPVVILSVTLRGVIEAYQRFDLTNKVRIPAGILNFVLPAILVSTGHDDLMAIVVALAIVRCVIFLVFARLVWSFVPECYSPENVSWSTAPILLRFGGWVSISNIISPLMVYGDRFLIASMLSATAVAYYATPYDVITRLWFIPVALSGVLFPTFSLLKTADASALDTLFNKSVTYIFALMYLITFVCIINAEFALTMWLGNAFAQESTLIMQIIAFGVLINSTAQIPFALIQASGKPRLTATLHMVELPVYFLILTIAIPVTGIHGVAWVWLARIIVDTTAMFVIANRVCDVSVPPGKSFSLLSVLLLLYLPVLVIDNHMARLAYSVAIVAVFGVAFWKWLVPDNDKSRTTHYVANLLWK